MTIQPQPPATPENDEPRTAGTVGALDQTHRGDLMETNTNPGALPDGVSVKGHGFTYSHLRPCGHIHRCYAMFDTPEAASHHMAWSVKKSLCVCEGGQ